MQKKNFNKKYYNIKSAYQLIFKKYNKSSIATCPRCNKIVYGETEIEKKFGHRLCNYMYHCRQSWCRECMNKRKNEAIEDFNFRRQKNKLFAYLINHSFSKN